MSFIFIPVKHSEIVAGLTGIFAELLNTPPPVEGGGVIVELGSDGDPFLLHAIINIEDSMKLYKIFFML